MTARGLFIQGKWSQGSGEILTRADPASGAVTWEGRASDIGDVERAVAAAVRASREWARLPLSARLVFLQTFAGMVSKRADELALAISRETGKPRWESRTEVSAIIAKVALTNAAYLARQTDTQSQKDGTTSATFYRPLGVVAVLGPFNLPAHLPNGQIVPALLAGNTVVFKPSEMTPLVGEIYAACWEDAGLPAGVFNLVQGGRETGAALAGDVRIHGVLFTGSRAGGITLSTLLAPYPEKLLALEMGGNNPLLATRVADIDAAAYTIIQSAFITAGQRCTCARRLILQQDDEGERLLQRVSAMAQNIRAGSFTDSPEPFMGPVISPPTAERLVEATSDLIQRGGIPRVELQRLGPAMLSPAVIDMTDAKRTDEELFGPILQVIRVPSIDAALEEANSTQYGLAAALLSDDAALWERFRREVHAGVVNWNRPTTGASGALPFGGLGASGNHRPAGAFAIDFCADPVATLECPALALPKTLAPGITL